METVIKEFISQELVRDPALPPVADETSLLESLEGKRAALKRIGELTPAAGGLPGRALRDHDRRRRPAPGEF